ncbi:MULTISPECIES: hypothetical protein [unclassified Pseudomonas]|jgi:alpha-D-ribose 1-methylphosphonate 5-triphosphate synthase subunit PhnG|uniref:hypothetical protein n=1 Tax=unclassified Pseudomonas TaxID=196821 RepID=UPI000C85BF39|nr:MULTISPECIES: hypothetical protein [unclassified Pseudomonas]AUO23084.1 hypothetical protein C0058_14250 [Pseudomonas sp. NC02]MBT1265808.1 hypothetical protein [Pseudomonas sp. VS38]NWA30902.1 hypothetical protein [Pseudomonas sp. C6002]NWB20247.1 hypothetical protein [Pseudomonas sp. D4002]NWB68199.1 hypothetical protein [Pseudomonas sp. I8001]
MGTEKTADKTPDAISSEQAQKGRQAADQDSSLQRPNPKTETIDKVITPTSIKDTQRQTEQINEQAAKAERKLGR